MITIIFSTIPVILGALLILASIWEFVTWRNRFSDWKDGMATSLGPVKNHGDVGPRLAYEYIVDGTSYEGLSSYMKDSLPEKGEGVHIYYDPADPEKSEWYDSGMHNFFMFGVALLGAFLIWLAL